MPRLLMPTGPVRYNDHLHYGFWSRCFQALGYEVFLYGPGASKQRGPSFRYPTYRKDRPMSDVAQEVQPDLYLSLGAHVAWHGWKQVSCPRIAVECDFHYVPSMHRYEGAEVVLVRDYHDPARAAQLPGGRGLRVEWVPFSIHEPFLENAQPPPPGRREPLVFFAGARQAKYYPVRSEAIDRLQAARLMAPKSVINGYSRGADYYSRVRQYCFGLACTSKWNRALAKHIEYAACGAAVYSDGSPGVDAQLPEYQRYTPETIVEQIQAAQKDIGLRREIMQAAKRTQAHVLEHHTDKKRFEDIRVLLEDVL